MLRNVHLHGALGQKFGRLYRLDVASAGEAGRALAAILPGFRQAVVGKWFRVVRGDRDTGMAIGESELGFQLGAGDLHIVPVLAGSGNRSGLGKIIAGVFLIGAAFFFPGAINALGASSGLGITATNVAGLGFALALAGLGQLLSAKASSEDQSSYLFSGDANITTQGGPVPLVYGKFRVAPVIIGAGLSTEDIAV